MPSLSIPPKELRRWTGPYLGNYYGTLWKTSNVDLDRNDGKIMLSRRLERIEDTISDFTGNTAFRTFVRTNADCTDRYWALADGGGLSKTDSASPENATLPSDSWDTDTLASTPVACRDMTVGFNDSRNDSGRNKLFVTLDSGDIAVLNDTGNNAWTASWWETKHSQPPLTPDGNGAVLARPIQYFPFRKITLVGSGNLVHTISRPSDTQNDTVTYARLTMPKDLNARHIFHTTNRAWVCCDHRYGGKGKIIEWDGFSETYNNIHEAHGVSALSGVDYNGTPIAINDKGVILEFNGQGFTPMIRSGQIIALPMVNDVGASLISGADTAITVSVAPRGMTVGEDGLIYINVSQATIASERYMAGIWCLNPMTGRLYNKHSLGRWGDSVDYGHKQINTPGGLYWVPGSVSSRSLLAGGIINISASAAAQTGIWLLEAETSTTSTRGYFITQFISANDIRDFWDSMWVRFQRFITSGSQIIVKARGVRSLFLANRRPLQATITWTSTTTFTLTLATADDSLLVGDEVEVLNGVNPGYLAHITVISGAHAALQTITIDETVTTGSSTSIARFDRWKKLGVINNTSRYEDNVPISIDSSFVQFKLELRGLASEMALTDLIVNYNPSIYNQK